MPKWTLQRTAIFAAFAQKGHTAQRKLQSQSNVQLDSSVLLQAFNKKMSVRRALQACTANGRDLLLQVLDALPAASALMAPLRQTIILMLMIAKILRQTQLIAQLDTTVKPIQASQKSARLAPTTLAEASRPLINALRATQEHTARMKA